MVCPQIGQEGFSIRRVHDLTRRGVFVISIEYAITLVCIETHKDFGDAIEKRLTLFLCMVKHAYMG